MASNVPNVRLVRCPKCHKVIAEFASVPVYQCGGCDTILRAKYPIATGDNVTLGMIEGSSKSTSDDGTLGNGLTSSDQKMIASSLEESNGTEKKTAPNYLFEANASTNCNEKGESSKHSTQGTEEQDSNSSTPRVTDPLVLETGTNLKEELEVPLNLSHDSLKESYHMVESADHVSQYVASEDLVDREHGDMEGEGMRSATGSSDAYDGSASSADDCGNNRAPNKYLLLSKRTFRHKKVLDTIDSKGKITRENRLENNEVAADVGSQLQSRSSPLQSSSERYDTTPATSSDSNGAELPSRYGFDSLNRESSINSEDFHSVQNWMKPENVAESSSLPRDSSVCGDSLSQHDGPAKLTSLRPDHVKILRKVDELRDNLSELFDQTVEGRRHSRLRGIREEELTPSPDSNLVRHSGACLPRHLHCNPEVCQTSMQSPANVCYCNGLCRACRKDTRSHPSSDVILQPHKDPNLTLHCDKIQIDEYELKNPRYKEGRQPISRHCRPVSGGAPFVICYKCLELLQLPADFLLSRKRFHKLQCGACSEVLLYSFRPRAPKVPQTLVGLELLPSENDNSTDMMARHEFDAAPSNGYPQEEPISFSEEFQLSLAKTDSTEPEMPLHVSRCSSYLTEERTDKQVQGPQLHRLMGYSSASELLYRFSDSDEGYRHNTGSATPRFYRPSEEIDTRDGSGRADIRRNQEYSTLGSPSNFMEPREEGESPRKSRTRTGALPLRGLLKKGIQELNNGLDSVKLKIQLHGRTIPAS